MIGSAIGSVVGGLFQASAAKKGAQAQVDAANQANETQRYIYDRNVDLSEPWRQTGQNALAAMAYEMGIGPSPTFGTASGTAGQASTGTNAAQIVEVPGSATQQREYFTRGDPRWQSDGGESNDWQSAMVSTPGASSFQVGDQSFGSRDDAANYLASMAPAATGSEGDGGYQGFKETPGYQFRLDEGQTALERMASARGMRLSGATLKDAARFGDGLASQEYGNYFNRLASLSGVGQTAVGAQQNAGTNYANATGQNAMMAGQARASGYQGQANAFGGTMNNLFSIYGAAQGGMFGQNPGFGIKPYGAV